MAEFKFVKWLTDCRMDDVAQVGGKNASLGELLSQLYPLGVLVPNGFATTAEAYRLFLKEADLVEKLEGLVQGLDTDDISALTQVGATIRALILKAPLPALLEQEITQAYQMLSQEVSECSVAVRSSATAEDLPDASFAGQQETYLNVRGVAAVLEKVKAVFASLFNDRAIAYRAHQGFANKEVALSAGIQRMVRSDLAASGVMFTLDTESGFDGVVFITSSYGLGELVVQGSVNPDEFYVHKGNLRAQRPAILRRQVGLKQERMVYSSAPGEWVKIIPVSLEEAQRFSLSDAEVEALARQALLIETHYGRPMDIEWAKDGQTGALFIVQARPETVQSRQVGQVMERYHLEKRGRILAEGRSVGQKIGSGTAKHIASIAQMHEVQVGDVLVADMTDPDWEPVMKKASAIITNRGGRTCHAAIIARELGIPAVVGCVDATERIHSGQMVTVSCAEGDTGFIYAEKLPFQVNRVALNDMPPLPFKMMMNVGNPDRAFHFQGIPNQGVGLARLEFIISQMIGIHPNACLQVERLAPELKAQVLAKTAAYQNPKEYYIERLVEGISTIAAAFEDAPVIIRFSDFKSNEYANLLGGSIFEPQEENPMIGFRGAARYLSSSFKEAFALECVAIKKVRTLMGFKNVAVMVPFVRTVSEAQAVIQMMAELGLERGVDDLKVMMMCELPTNAILAERYLEYFDGFSIGSNDMTQLTLGLDRDSALVAAQFDERDEAVKWLLARAIKACRAAGKYVGICGQGPSDHPDLAQWLVDQGIESISLNPDTVLATWLYLSKK